MHLRLSVAALSVAAFSWPSAAVAQDYYTDVRPDLVENCTGCYSDDGIAWSMENAEETFAERRRIAGAIATRNMPPWLAEMCFNFSYIALEVGETATETSGR